MPHCNAFFLCALGILFVILIRMIIEVKSEQETRQLGEKIGRRLQGGEVFELVGDVGAGKTTFVKGLARGMGITGHVQSPSFTISQVHENPQGLRLAHYDFYRLADPGIMSEELTETTCDMSTVTVIEWADTVAHVLPKEHLRIEFLSTSENGRRIELPQQIGAAV